MHRTERLKFIYTSIIRWTNRVQKLTVFTLKASANALCEGGRCNPGQRNGLKCTDITDIDIFMEQHAARTLSKPLPNIELIYK